ncbi:hypothetical protein BC938DRAFT_473142 [Jimgerdemannia flammicorona]|uniref:NmrA-like domain-containing protein n=1 Tax=Jimgerdemannia flammicorona TaxID=994334 RepID=A0A433Q4J4_9FUNG|nr:hypothetical protein BC938DRAFT_473142 [Jimgerdemannia flammicorona]
MPRALCVLRGHYRGQVPRLTLSVTEGGSLSEYDIGKFVTNPFRLLDQHGRVLCFKNEKLKRGGDQIKLSQTRNLSRQAPGLHPSLLSSSISLPPHLSFSLFRLTSPTNHADMTTFKSVFVAGATGLLGDNIVEALLSDGNLDVAVLFRPHSVTEHVPRKENWESRGVRVVISEFANQQRLVTAMQEHLKLLTAAKLAGVKRFIPADLGATEEQEEVLEENHEIKAVRQAVVKSGLEYTFLYWGAIMEGVLGPLTGIDTTNARAWLVGDGNARVVLTRGRDIGKYIIGSLRSPMGRNASLYVAGDIKTLNEVISIFQEVSGKKFNIQYRAIADVEAQITANPYLWTNVPDQISVWIAKEIVFFGDAHFINNSDFPEVHPAKVIDFARETFAQILQQQQ